MDPLLQPTLGGVALRDPGPSRRAFAMESIRYLAIFGGAFPAALIFLWNIRRLPLTPAERPAAIRAGFTISVGALLVTAASFWNELAFDGPEPTAKLLRSAVRIGLLVFSWFLVGFASRPLKPAWTRWYYHCAAAEIFPVNAALWIPGLVVAVAWRLAALQALLWAKALP